MRRARAKAARNGLAKLYAPPEFPNCGLALSRGSGVSSGVSLRLKHAFPAFACHINPPINRLLLL
jgi:hypothetical protein